MKSKYSNWFEIKVKSEKVQEDGSSKKVAEIYIVEADTFTGSIHRAGFALVAIKMMRCR